MTNAWPPMPKHLMAKIYANHRRRQPASKGPYALTRTDIDRMRVTDEENGAATEWQLKQAHAGVRFVCITSQPPATTERGSGHSGSSGLQ
ncbi:MAG: hypothetical protein EOO82_01355 [Oxalobacteraceae bacterium]|nr:MAG: hypothetical protein EOO82_01355 [Oxalobacteraceae bacterium]